MAADGENDEEARLMAYRPGGGCRAMQLPVEVERAVRVPFADKQRKGESGEERIRSARDERRGPFPPSTMPASIELSIKLVVCLRDGGFRGNTSVLTE